MRPIVQLALALYLSLTFGLSGCRRPGSAPRHLPDFNLTAVTAAQTRSVQRADFLGKVWIVSFMFTRCHGPCPINSARMAQLQGRLPPAIKLATFTVDPKHDQAEALGAYAKLFHADADRWLFLTGPSEESLIPLFKDTFQTAYRANPRSACGYETYHSAKFFLMDRAGAIRGEYDSEQTAQMQQLEADAIALLTEDGVAINP